MKLKKDTKAFQKRPKDKVKYQWKVYVYFGPKANDKYVDRMLKDPLHLDQITPWKLTVELIELQYQLIQYIATHETENYLRELREKEDGRKERVSYVVEDIVPISEEVNKIPHYSPYSRLEKWRKVPTFVKNALVQAYEFLEKSFDGLCSFLKQHADIIGWIALGASAVAVILKLLSNIPSGKYESNSEFYQFMSKRIGPNHPSGPEEKVKLATDDFERLKSSVKNKMVYADAEALPCGLEDYVDGVLTGADFQKR
jgi:hypothetical protein